MNKYIIHTNENKGKNVARFRRIMKIVPVLYFSVNARNTYNVFVFFEVVFGVTWNVESVPNCFSIFCISKQ